jgi:hypothetical protein
LVEGAVRSALDPGNPQARPTPAASPSTPASSPTLLDSFSKPKESGVKITFLDDSGSA